MSSSDFRHSSPNIDSIIENRTFGTFYSYSLAVQDSFILLFLICYYLPTQLPAVLAVVQSYWLLMVHTMHPGVYLDSDVDFYLNEKKHLLCGRIAASLSISNCAETKCTCTFLLSISYFNSLGYFNMTYSNSC